MVRIETSKTEKVSELFTPASELIERFDKRERKNLQIHIRTTYIILKKIKALRDKFPDLYQSDTHVIQAAVNYLYAERVGKDETVIAEDL